MYSDLGAPCPCRVEGFRFRGEGSPFWGSWCGATRVFWDGISGAEAGRRKEDVGLQTREASVSNLASWRPGLVLPLP